MRLQRRRKRFQLIYWMQDSSYNITANRFGTVVNGKHTQKWTREQASEYQTPENCRINATRRQKPLCLVLHFSHLKFSSFNFNKMLSYSRLIEILNILACHQAVVRAEWNNNYLHAIQMKVNLWSFNFQLCLDFFQSINFLLPQLLVRHLIIITNRWVANEMSWKWN